jgi:hypothetical protein
MRTNEQQHRSACRSYAVARTASREDHHRRILLTFAYTLAAATIAVWFASLSTNTGSILTTPNIVPQHLTTRGFVNRLHKGDRLGAAKFSDRWHGIATTAKSPQPRKALRRTPVGCEPPFSRLANIGNISGRCVTSLDSSTKLAAAN